MVCEISPTTAAARWAPARISLIDSPAWRARSTPSLTRLTPVCMLLTACSVLLRMRWIMSVISWVDCAVRAARLRTSSATTAKPRPASPARAASMAAFRASRLVCSAMLLITWMIE
ncbi:hypothetical protein D3C85_1305570 [compost metagenome]